MEFSLNVLKTYDQLWCISRVWCSFTTE